MIPAMMDAATLFAAMSPSKTCKVRVSSTRYRNDPYRARVMPRIQKPVASPAFKNFFAAPVPKPFVAMPPTLNFAPAPVINAPVADEVRARTATPSPVPKAPVTEKPKELPKAAQAQSQQPAASHFALIGFKHETAMYQAPFRVAPGDVVIVEADRGEHIGVVQSITTTKPAYPVPSRVMRRASAAEAAVVDELTSKEKRVAAAVQKQAESLGLGIRIVDVEFQMDCNKLTVFFASKVFVDFRKLQRALFREFRCRIWLVNWAEVRSYTPVPVNAPVA